jgi:hypothetical protein
MLRHYGDGGRAINLPKVSANDYESAVKYRQSEQQEYASLRKELEKARRELQTSRAESVEFAGYINEFLSQPLRHDTARAGLGGDSHSNDGRDSVLPPKSGAIESDTNDGSIISSKVLRDEPTPSRSNSVGRNDDAKLEAGTVGSETVTGTDAGGAATVEPKQYVDRQADQHSVAE